MAIASMAKEMIWSLLRDRIMLASPDALFFVVVFVLVLFTIASVARVGDAWISSVLNALFR